MPTQDVLLQNLSKETQDVVHKAIREQLLPFARRHYPHLNAAFDKQPYPRPGNLFIVRYSAASGHPGGRGLKMHKDETALTFNLCLSPQDGFEGGGTYFPVSSTDVDGIVLRPTPGYCLMHDGAFTRMTSCDGTFENRAPPRLICHTVCARLPGNIKHAGNDVISGDRFILVGFYNADGRDRAGEEAYFSKKALEATRAELALHPPSPIQTIYFTTAVAASNNYAGCGPSAVAQHTRMQTATLHANDNFATVGASPTPAIAPCPLSQTEPRPMSSVAIQGPLTREENTPGATPLVSSISAVGMDRADDADTATDLDLGTLLGSSTDRLSVYGQGSAYTNAAANHAPRSPSKQASAGNTGSQGATSMSPCQRPPSQGTAPDDQTAAGDSTESDSSDDAMRTSKDSCRLQEASRTSSLPKSSMTVSCVPGWPLFQIFHNKAKARS